MGKGIKVLSVLAVAVVLALVGCGETRDEKEPPEGGNCEGHPKW
jgi:hypothetical protein